MVCYGVVHLLVAWLAVQVAFGESEQADQKGAVGSLTETSVGPVLLWALGVGLIAYALWQILMIFTGYTWVEKGRQRFLRKFGAGSRAFVAAAIGIYTIELTSGSGSGGSSNQTTQEGTAKLMAQPFGQILVGILALVILGVAFVAVRRGVRKLFLEDLDRSQLPKPAEPLGVAGHTAKGLSYGIIGILVGIAAVNADPGQAQGLDGALKTLQAQTFGSVLLFVVGLGFAAYGLFCFAVAKAHKA
nr:Membrane protein, putative [Kibdelosporangium sp. MJ126-NF4]